MVFLAGPVAEAKLSGTAMRSYGCRSDLEICVHICERLHLYRNRRSKALGVEMANRLRSQTALILGRPEVWRAVVAIAEDLKAWSQLTGHDAADIAQWTKRLRNQLSLALPLPNSRSGIDSSKHIPRLAA